MNWLWAYRIRLYIRNSIWIFPALSLIAGLVAVAQLSRLEQAYGWELNISRDTAATILSTVAGSMFTLVILVSSAVLVAVQLASGQLTPRIITLIYRNPYRKFAMSVFAFTFTFSVGVLARLGDNVPWLTSYLAAYGFIFNLILFLFFIDSVGKTLRPGTVLQTVALYGREIIKTVYPLRFDEVSSFESGPINGLTNKPQHVVFSKKDGVLLAFDTKKLVSLAESSNCLIELVPEAGEYVAEGDVLFQIYHGGDDLSEDTLCKSVALGPERNMDQDPTFPFRIIVDIAARALSPAVNDPTTAVLAIDQLHHLLREVGSRYLGEGRECDESGRVRLIYRTPEWEDFVHLAVTEIRQYGRDSIQVVRRLRTMMENLIEILPMQRLPVLQSEIHLLNDSSKQAFPTNEERSLAETGDFKGMGGSRDHHHRIARHTETDDETESAALQTQSS